MPAENMHMKKITARIRRDLLNLHICEQDLYILLCLQCREYMKKYLIALHLLQSYLSQFRSSCLSVSSSSSSFTFFTISPFLMSSPSPIPPAMPMSASFASPGPFTTQPMTATLILSRGMSCTIFSTSLARLMRSIFVLPHVGQDTTSIPPFLRPSVLRISFAVRISSAG